MPRRGVAKLQFHIAHFTSREGPSVRKQPWLAPAREPQHIRRVGAGGLETGLPVAARARAMLSGLGSAGPISGDLRVVVDAASQSADDTLFGETT